MLNKKWLIASLFIPLYGAIVNLIILLRQFHKNYNNEKEYSVTNKQFFLWGGVIACAFFASMVLIAAINYICVKITGLYFDYILWVAVAISGYVANIVFYLFYRKYIKPAFENGFKTKDDEGDQIE